MPINDDISGMKFLPKCHVNVVINCRNVKYVCSLCCNTLLFVSEGINTHTDISIYIFTEMFIRSSYMVITQYKSKEGDVTC